MAKSKLKTTVDILIQLQLAFEQTSHVREDLSPALSRKGLQFHQGSGKPSQGPTILYSTRSQRWTDHHDTSKFLENSTTQDKPY